MDPSLNFETDLRSLRRLYGLLHANANNESIPQAFLLDENTQFLLKGLLDSATEQLLARQSKILAQVQLGLPTPSRNSVSRSVIKLPSKVGLAEEVVDSIERIETQLSAFSFCSSREDRARTRKSRTIEGRQSYQASVSGLRSSYKPPSQTTRTSNIAHHLPSSCDDRTLNLESQESSSSDDQVVLVRSRPPLPSRPKPRESNRTSSMKPTLLDQETETWDEESDNTRSGTSSKVSSTDQESEEASRETGSTTGSSWQTHGESVTESEEDSSYPSESDDNNSQVSDSPPHKTRANISNDAAKQRKKTKGRLKRFKEKLGKVFHHHHYHHHHHESKEQGRKPSAWKHLVKKHLQKDKEKLVERRMKSESKGLVTKHKNKGGQFHALVEGLMRHRRRHSKMKKQSHVRKNNWWKNRRRQGGIKFTNRGRVKLGKTNYLCNKDQEHDEN